MEALERAAADVYAVTAVTLSKSEYFGSKPLYTALI